MKIFLSRYEKETIITFNRYHDRVFIFTYEPRIKRAIERKNLGEMILDNGLGGREYELPYRSLRIQFLNGRPKVMVGENLSGKVVG